MSLSPVWRFALMTFGCKVNQYESQALREAWLGLGGVEVPVTSHASDSHIPHIVLINTCAVTAKAVADVRQAVLRLRRIWPYVPIGLVGCAITAEKEIERSLSEVSFVLPQAQKAMLLQGPQVLLDKVTCPHFRKAFEPFSMTVANERNQDSALVEESRFTSHGDSVKDETSRSVFPPFSINTFTRARPILKVQDGCTQGCTYCIVPLARGKSRSRPFEAILAEAERLLLSGAREIMLSGINLREYHYRMDGALSFWTMLKRLDDALAPRWQGHARLRISSLDPAQLNTEGLDTLKATSLVCPHIHLSLQSGSPKVLERMGRRHYTPERVMEAVTDIATHWPIMGLGADMLMGFAGEDQSALEESLSVITILPLTYAHIFTYSERPGTIAANFVDHLPKTMRQHHARQMRKLITIKRQDFLKRMMNMPMLVIAPDGAGSTKGVDAHYISCHAKPDAKPFSAMFLQAVKPVGISKEGLVVETIIV